MYDQIMSNCPGHKNRVKYSCGEHADRMKKAPGSLIQSFSKSGDLGFIDRSAVPVSY